ncbi:hypothetical protein RRG08_060582 [Elysia crispata]|uniref:Spaetzle domain-containing protein n=1 Tax=Elysia crispata TaxID=231223 RepID=A0AAE1AMB0_9GAST|nr:hypothetical protein RRG08_060582 [Elysia crispata]
MSRICVSFLFVIILETVIGGQRYGPDGYTTHFTYWQLPQGMRGLFRTETELLQDTVLLSGGPSKPREHTVWINRQNFLSNHRDADKTIRQFMTDNRIHGAGSIEFHSGRFVQGCCPHLSFFSAVDSLTNINGIKKYLVHFENQQRYQYVPFALCTGKQNYGEHGHCFQGTTVLNLLSYKDGRNLPVVFDQFEVPTYCGCVQY